MAKKKLAPLQVELGRGANEEAGREKVQPENSSVNLCLDFGSLPEQLATKDAEALCPGIEMPDPAPDALDTLLGAFLKALEEGNCPAVEPEEPPLYWWQK